MLSEISAESLMTASSLTLIPSSTISTCFGSVDQLLDLVEDPQPGSCLTISLVLPSSTQLDGDYLTGDFSIKSVQSFPIQILTWHRVNDPESLKQFVRKEGPLDSYRWQPLAQKEPSQPYSLPVEDIEAKTVLTEQMLTKLNICQA